MAAGHAGRHAYAAAGDASRADPMVRQGEELERMRIAPLDAEAAMVAIL